MRPTSRRGWPALSAARWGTATTSAPIWSSGRLQVERALALASAPLPSRVRRAAVPGRRVPRRHRRRVGTSSTDLALGAMAVLDAPAARGRDPALPALDRCRRPRPGHRDARLDRRPPRSARSIARLVESTSPVAARIARRRRRRPCGMMTIRGSGVSPDRIARRRRRHGRHPEARLGEFERCSTPGVPLFGRLAPEDLAARGRGRERTLTSTPGEVIVREGDVGDELFVILEGPGPRGPPRAGRVGRGCSGRTVRATTSASSPSSWNGRGSRGRGRRRERPDAGPRWRRADRDPARATGRRDGDARDARRADQRPVTDLTPARTSPLPTGTVTFLRTRCRRVDGPGSRSSALAWDALNAEHLALDPVGRRWPRVASSSGPRATPCSRPSPRPAPRSRRRSRPSGRWLPTPWPDDAAVRVRIGLHTGEAHLAGDDYGGFDVNRAARVAAVGHGGQVIVSETTAALVARPAARRRRPPRSRAHVIRDVPRPERLAQLDIPGLPDDLPAATRGPTRPGRPARAADELRRARARSSTRCSTWPADRTTGDAHRTGRHRQVQPGRRGRHGGWRPTYRDGAWFVAARGRSPTRPMSKRPSPARSACSTDRSGPRPPPWTATWPSDRCSWSWTTSSRSSTRAGVVARDPARVAGVTRCS